MVLKTNQYLEILIRCKMNAGNIVIMICEFSIWMLFTIIIVFQIYQSVKNNIWNQIPKVIIEFALEISDVIGDIFHYNLLTRFGEFYDLFFNGLWLIKCSILLLNFSNNSIHIAFIWISCILISMISFYLIV